ncbi:MAG: hypothetical protein ABIU87_01165, partial [Ornithinibacter sp.]
RQALTRLAGAFDQLPAIVTLSIGPDASAPIRYGIAGVALVIVAASVAYSKSKDLAIGGDIDPDDAPVEKQAPVGIS